MTHCELYKGVRSKYNIIKDLRIKYKPNFDHYIKVKIQTRPSTKQVFPPSTYTARGLESNPIYMESIPISIPIVLTAFYQWQYQCQFPWIILAMAMSIPIFSQTNNNGNINSNCFETQYQWQWQYQFLFKPISMAIPIPIVVPRQ